MKRLGITGTRLTMEGTVYPEVLTKNGIEFRARLRGLIAERSITSSSTNS